MYQLKYNLKRQKKRRWDDSRDVTAGATGATTVAPKFSDTLTLFQPERADFAPLLQRSHQKFPHGYISGLHNLKNSSVAVFQRAQRKEKRVYSKKNYSTVYPFIRDLNLDVWNTLPN